ncbi:MAG: hypothetical protein HON55_02390 [Legionellales bacterium]|jgi:hypothetical protein|nr:hypothetical protein [Legionellales bacterium]
MINNIDNTYSNFIDLTSTTAISAGKQALALQIIELFLEELPEFKQTLIKADQQHDRVELGKIIHKMFGACAICIAPSIKAQLDNLSVAYEAKESCLLAHITTLNSAIDNTIEFCAQNNLGDMK